MIHIQSMQFPFITHGMVLYINDSIYRQNTNIEKMYVYASELRKFRRFYILRVCYFFQYFVGTSDTLSVQMTCLSAYMYRQISKCTDKSPKRLYGGGGGAIHQNYLVALNDINRWLCLCNNVFCHGMHEDWFWHAIINSWLFTWITLTQGRIQDFRGGGGWRKRLCAPVA